MSRLNQISIEKVSNGFIVYENVNSYEVSRGGEVPVKKVFQSKRALNKYINEGFSDNEK